MKYKGHSVLYNFGHKASGGFKGQHVLYMAFNKNACKRLSIIAGIERESSKVVDIIDKIVQEFLVRTLRRVINVVIFAGRKTITVEDIQFLSRVCPDQLQIACPTDLSKLLSMCTNTENVLDEKRGYALFTLKRPFDQLVRKIVRELCKEEVRIGANVSLLLQSMTEHHVISIMNHAATYIARSNRDTLLPRDIENACETSRQTRYGMKSTPISKKVNFSGAKPQYG